MIKYKILILKYDLYEEVNYLAQNWCDLKVCLNIKNLKKLIFRIWKYFFIFDKNFFLTIFFYKD